MLIYIERGPMRTLEILPMESSGSDIEKWKMCYPISSCSSHSNYAFLAV
jgi:hypothetical protein